MSMKEAFDTFFEEMTQNYLNKRGVLPRAPCNEKRRPTGLFLLETLNNEGYAQWKPRLQKNLFLLTQWKKSLAFQFIRKSKTFYLPTGFFL